MTLLRLTPQLALALALAKDQIPGLCSMCKSSTQKTLPHTLLLGSWLRTERVTPTCRVFQRVKRDSDLK